MSLYVIGDLHLSLSADKPMDIFGGWENYVDRLQANWNSVIAEKDSVVILGDVSWAMSLNDTFADFNFINNLTGTKYIIKGNHDYWWTSKTKMDAFFKRNGLETLNIIHNNSVVADNIAVCGTRGWLFEKGEPQDKKVLAREAGRLRTSILSVKDNQAEKIAFLHYPPVYGDEISAEIIDVLLEYNIKRCFYGHIHSSACSNALNGKYLGIDFRLVSADFLRFNPYKIEPSVNY
ncbi:MAG TPA: serine/threonine protein phosphatase [Ruminococcaceae bacterium]|nr:serine/threonine protein phosphatase [Oscillospiraceae bacterium]